MEIKGSALISTLGTEPQVVTLSAYELLRKGEHIERVIVIHSASSQSEILAAREILTASWDSLPFGPSVKLELAGIPARDLASELSLKAAYSTVRNAILRLKEKGLRIHLNISGGRKTLALCALIAAQFLFDADDQVWYLFSSPKLVKSRRLLPEPSDRYQLIRIPVPLWTESTSLLAAMAAYEDPWALAQLQRRLVHQEERTRWKHFLEYVLSPAEKEVVEELVKVGGTDAEIASRLGKSPRTVGHQLSHVFRKVRTFLGLPEEIRVDRTMLVSLLAPYFREFSL